MTPIERFANAAEAFRRWASEGTTSGELAATEGLANLAELFAAALALPPTDSVADDPPRVSVDEWQQVFRACSRLPVQYYGEVFEPLTMPPGEPSVGDVADDIADIYRDVVTGLRAYQRGNTAEAVWQWRFLFWCHWGRHATGAMCVLRAWLEAHRSSA